MMRTVAVAESMLSGILVRPDFSRETVDVLADEAKLVPRPVLDRHAGERDDDVGMSLVGHDLQKRDLAREAVLEHLAVDACVREVAVPPHL
jgi:hypothetical protein